MERDYQFNARSGAGLRVARGVSWGNCCGRIQLRGLQGFRSRLQRRQSGDWRSQESASNAPCGGTHKFKIKGMSRAKSRCATKANRHMRDWLSYLSQHPAAGYVDYLASDVVCSVGGEEFYCGGYVFGAWRPAHGRSGVADAAGFVGG